jgi:hypothetical protein
MYVMLDTHRELVFQHREAAQQVGMFDVSQLNRRRAARC